MAARHIGLPQGLTEQPGRRISINKTGLFTCLTRFTCDASNLVQLIPPIGSQHPEFRFATLDEITGVSEEGDRAALDCIYKGMSPGNSGAGSERPTYRLIASTREEPLATHKRYKPLTRQDIQKARAFVDEMDPSAPMPTFSNQELGVELVGKMLRGQESYLARGLIWREESSSDTAWSSIDDVGKISVPAGNPPSNGTGNWLLSSMEQEQQGEAFKKSREWQASDPAGWDPDFYT